MRHCGDGADSLREGVSMNCGVANCKDPACKPKSAVMTDANKALLRLWYNLDKPICYGGLDPGALRGDKTSFTVVFTKGESMPISEFDAAIDRVQKKHDELKRMYAEVSGILDDTRRRSLEHAAARDKLEARVRGMNLANNMLLRQRDSLVGENQQQAKEIADLKVQRDQLTERNCYPIHCVQVSPERYTEVCEARDRAFSELASLRVSFDALCKGVANQLMNGADSINRTR